MSKEASKERSWLTSVAHAGRRVFPHAGTHSPTPAERANALLAFVQRTNLGTLVGQGLQDATAEVAFVSLDGSPLPLGRQPNVNGPELADFADQLRGMIEQLRVSGESGPRESGMMIPAHLRHIMIWDPGEGGPAQSFLSGPFLMRALWRGRMLLGDHLDKIERCERCGKFFMARKSARFCSLQCAQNARAARFIGNLEPEQRKRVRQRDYFSRLKRKDPAAADRYLSRLRAIDPTTARRLKTGLHEKKTRRRMRWPRATSRRPPP